MLTTSTYAFANYKMDSLTRAKISISLKGRMWSPESKAKRRTSILGINHYNQGRSLPVSTLDAAALVLGKPIYVYDTINLRLVNGRPFRSIREAVKELPISQPTLPKKLDNGKPFKGYYYYSVPHKFS